MKWYGLPQQTISLQIFSRLSSTNFAWSILEYFAPLNLVKAGALYGIEHDSFQEFKHDHKQERFSFLFRLFDSLISSYFLIKQLASDFLWENSYLLLNRKISTHFSCADYVTNRFLYGEINLSLFQLDRVHRNTKW